MTAVDVMPRNDTYEHEQRGTNFCRKALIVDPLRKDRRSSRTLSGRTRGFSARLRLGRDERTAMHHDDTIIGCCAPGPPDPGEYGCMCQRELRHEGPHQCGCGIMWSDEVAEATKEDRHA